MLIVKFILGCQCLWEAKLCESHSPLAPPTALPTAPPGSSFHLVCSFYFLLLLSKRALRKLGIGKVYLIGNQLKGHAVIYSQLNRSQNSKAKKTKIINICNYSIFALSVIMLGWSFTVVIVVVFMLCSLICFVYYQIASA